MRKCKLFLALLVLIGVVMGNCTMAEAAESEVVIVHVGQTVEQLSEDEAEILFQGPMGEPASPMATDNSYTVYRYTDAFDYYVSGNWIGRADTECVVWRYTDGKVHLYQRSIQLTRSLAVTAARMYGSIINTDGSYSYTLGDRVHFYLDAGTVSFAVDFYVSATEAYFSSYQVY